MIILPTWALGPFAKPDDVWCRTPRPAGPRPYPYPTRPDRDAGRRTERIPGRRRSPARRRRPGRAARRRRSDRRSGSAGFPIRSDPTDRARPRSGDAERVPAGRCSGRGGRCWAELETSKLAASVRFVASSRPVMRYAKEASDITRCSAIGLLPQRASPATARSGAWGTTSPRSSDRPWTREPTRRLPASRRSGASSPGQVNPGEVLIKAVTRGKPKMLTGLDQKVRGQVQGLDAPLARMAHHRPRGTTSPRNDRGGERSNPVAPPRGKADCEGS